MDQLRYELENAIANHIKRKLADKIENKIKHEIDNSIRFNDYQDDHVNPRPAPDTIMKITQKQFDPIDRFTKLRRYVYDTIRKGGGNKSIRKAMKKEAIEKTQVESSVQNSDIYLILINKSPLLTYLRSGKTGEYASRTDEKIRREIIFLEKIVKDSESPHKDDSMILEYIKMLKNLITGKNTIKPIPIRDILRASADTIGKDFIVRSIKE